MKKKKFVNGVDDQSTCITASRGTKESAEGLKETFKDMDRILEAVKKFSSDELNGTSIIFFVVATPKVAEAITGDKLKEDVDSVAIGASKIDGSGVVSVLKTLDNIKERIVERHSAHILGDMPDELKKMLRDMIE